MFEKALRLKLRFETSKGPLSVEDLWDLPLTSTNSTRANLDDIGKAFRQQLKSDDNISLVMPETKTDDVVQLKFDIVKHIIDVRLAEAKTASDKRDRAEKKQKLMAILADRENESWKTMPMEELRKALSEL